MNPNYNYQPLPNPELPNRPDYLDTFDDDELTAYALYLEQRGLEDCANSAEQFEGDYWGLYNSIDEFTNNWDYQAEPMDAIQFLLADYPELEGKVSLAELALIDRLADDMEFHFDGGQVTIFTKPPTNDTGKEKQ